MQKTHTYGSKQAVSPGKLAKQSQGHRLVSGGFETQTWGCLILQLFVQCSLEKALQEVPYM